MLKVVIAVAPHPLGYNINMYYTYLLKSERDNSFYIGSTNDLKKRFIEHNKGKSVYTSKKLPWILLYYEAYTTRSLAIKREKQLKRYAKSFAMLKKRLEL